MARQPMLTEEELAKQRKWIDDQCLFKIGDVIEWTECIAFITDIMLGFPKGCDHLSKYEGIRIVYRIEWIAHPQKEADERFVHQFEKGDVEAYGIKLASERWQVLYGKTEV